MKTILCLSLSFILFGCAVSHKRGSDAQVTVDYYLENRGDLPTELSKILSMDDQKEGEVTVQWSVNEKGQVQNISIPSDTLQNNRVNDRIIEHLKAMKFPKSPRFTTTTVEYTYKFQTSKKH